MVLSSRQEKILEDALELLTIGIVRGCFEYEMEELYEIDRMIHNALSDEK